MLTLLIRRLPARRGVLPVTAFVVATLSLAVASCNDPFAPNAAYSVVTDSFSLYAITGTPPTYPSAVDIYYHSGRRIDPGYSYDIAFDLDPQGNVRIIPVQLMGGAVTAGRTVGLQKITGSYDAVQAAPGSGYEYDSALVVAPGEGVIVQVLSDLCSTAASQLLYAKFKVLATSVTSRAIAVAQVLDPNCGFRSFAEGVPKN